MNLARESLKVQPDGGERLIEGFFMVQLVGAILLQKFAVPTGAAPAELCLPLMLAGLAVLVVRGRFMLDPLRLLLFGAFLVSCLASQLISGSPMSGPAFLIMIALYVMMLFRLDVSPATYFRCLNQFQTAMLIVCGVVVVQHLVQVAASWTLWPNLDRLVPSQLLLPGYNYLQPLRYASRFEKPHGIVFLETSFVSQFAALAAIIELVYFRRLAHLAAYVALLLMLFAGTGLLVLGLTAPFLLPLLPRKALLWLLVGTAAAAVVAVASGWFAQVQDRVFEFQHPGTSGYYRFTVPFQTLIERAGDPASLMTGFGAGSTPTRDASVLTPPAKLAFEYGFVPALLFFVFFVISLFKSAPSMGVAVGLLMFYLFGGGSFAVPVYVVMCVLLGSLFRIERPADRTFPLPALQSWSPAPGAPLS
jgi:hypothetical protein